MSSGAVTDDPTAKIELKTFHCEIINDHDAIKAEEDACSDPPKSAVSAKGEIDDNYTRIKDEEAMIIEMEMERIYDTPELVHLLVAREE